MSLRFSLYKFVFLLADNEHRTRRRANDPLGSAADREMFPAGVTVRRDYNQIEIKFFGGFHDLVSGQPGPDSRLDMPGASHGE